jgi:predicted SnoaL-like aldol condensation-catalyzing enzyme
MVLGEGDFVLSISEATTGPEQHRAIYDLFRLAGGLIVEHWDVVEDIPPRDTWLNDNGKF